MTPPRCIVCRRRPVRQRRAGRPLKRPLRIIDGLSWNWVCSQRCAGRDCGRANISTGRVQLAIERSREGRMRAAERRAEQLVADEVRSLISYGVPRSIAVATLTSLVRRTSQQLKDRLYHEWVRKPRRESRSDAA